MPKLTDDEIQSVLSSLTIRDFRKRRGISETRVKELAAEVAASTPAASVDGMTMVVAEILASNAGPITTEGSLKAVYPDLPPGAKRAKVLFEVNSTDNADTGSLQYQGVEGITSPEIAKCVAGASDARSEVVDVVNLDASGGFKYIFTNTSATTIDWAVTCFGYSMT